MYKLFYKHRNRNKKGVTLVELIVVMAIMGILAVGIMGLLNGSGSMYKKGRDLVAAKDISSIAEDYISTMIVYKTQVNLQPNATRPSTQIGGTQCVNAVNNDAFMLYSEGGRIIYKANATATPEPLFDEEFYGSYYVELSFVAMPRTDGLVTSINIKLNLKSSADAATYSYESAGTTVRILNFGSANQKQVNCFTTEYEDIEGNRYYKNKIVAGNSYPYIYAF